VATIRKAAVDPNVLLGIIERSARDLRASS